MYSVILLNVLILLILLYVLFNYLYLLILKKEKNKMKQIKEFTSSDNEKKELYNNNYKKWKMMYAKIFKDNSILYKNDCDGLDDDKMKPKTDNLDDINIDELKIIRKIQHQI